MKILYLTQFFYPENAAAAIRAYENAKIWTELGHEVTVFTGYPNFPTGKIFDGYTPKLMTEESVEDIRVLRSKLIAKPNTSKLKRGVMYLSFPFFAVWNLLFNKKRIGRDYDVILTTSGPVFTLSAGRLFVRLLSRRGHRIPSVAEFRDLTFRQLTAAFGESETFTCRIVRRIELSAAKKSALTVTVTEGFRHELIEHSIEADKICVIPNGVQTETHDLEGAQTRREWRRDIPSLISYFGAFGVSQNLTAAIDIVGRIPVPVRLLFIGDGAEKEKLHEYVRTHQPGCEIEILGSRPQAELEPFYEDSALCLVSLKNEPAFCHTLPSKLFQIMGRKRAILFIGPEGEAARLVRDAAAGIVLVGSLDENAAALADFFSQTDFHEQLTQMGENGYGYVQQHYDRRELARVYVKKMEEIIQCSRS